LFTDKKIIVSCNYTHADGSRGGRVFTVVCLSVFPHNISKSDKATITKLDVEMFHCKSWRPIYFGFEKSKVKVTSHKNNVGVDLCTLVSAGFF